MEENAIVSEVSFGETSNGAAMVQGSYVGQGSSENIIFFLFILPLNLINYVAHARMSGPFGNRGSNESREQTIANGAFLNIFNGLSHLYCHYF